MSPEPAPFSPNAAFGRSPKLKLKPSPPVPLQIPSLKETSKLRTGTPLSRSAIIPEPSWLVRASVKKRPQKPAAADPNSDSCGGGGNVQKSEANLGSTMISRSKTWAASAIDSGKTVAIASEHSSSSERRMVSMIFRS
jgi:hypothetical protein